MVVAKKGSERDELAHEPGRVAELLTNIFIVDASRAGMGRDAIRRVLGVGAKRVSSVFMHIQQRGN